MDLSNVKPFQVILLVVFGVLAVTGLLVFANFGGFGGGSAKLGTVTIWGTLPQSSMNTVLNAIKAGNQNYIGVSYVEKPEATFDVDLAEAIASGNGPDLILISQEELLTEQNKLLVIPFSTISQRAYLDAYLPIDELFLASNGTYGIPLAVDPLVLYYNRSMLTTAGVAQPPATWEAVTGLAQQITRAQSGTISQSTIPFGVYDNVENARAIISLLFLQSGSPVVTVSDSGPHARLTDPGADNATTPAQSALNFYTQFSDPVKTVYTWNRVLPSARQSFLAGTLAFYPGFASELPSLKAANPNLDFDMTAIPQPQTGTQRVSYAQAYAFSVPKASKNASGAVSVALALANSSLAQTTSQALSMAPATRASLTTTSSDRYQPVYFPQALIAKAWLSPSPAVTDRIFSTMITNITSGRLGVGDALTTANQAIDASL